MHRTIIVCALWLAAASAQAQPAPVQAQVRAPVQAERLRAERVQQTPPQDGSSMSTNGVVAAQAGWQAMGVEVASGGELQVTVSPDARWAAYSPNSTNVTAARINRDPRTDANGYPQSAGRVPNTPAPNDNYGALVGRIGDNGTPFLVGASYRGAVNESGMLFLAINDAPDQLRDNSGRLPVSITAVAPPPPVEPPAPEEEAAPEQTAPQGEPPIAGDAPPVQPPLVDVGPTETSGPTLLSIGLIAAAVIAALLLISGLFRPRGGGASESQPREVGAGNVTARVTSDGVAGQTLTLTMKGGR